MTHPNPAEGVNDNVKQGINPVFGCGKWQKLCENDVPWFHRFAVFKIRQPFLKLYRYMHLIFIIYIVLFILAKYVS